MLEKFSGRIDRFYRSIGAKELRDQIRTHFFSNEKEA